jgi:hypothetical protein
MYEMGSYFQTSKLDISPLSADSPIVFCDHSLNTSPTYACFKTHSCHCMDNSFEIVCACFSSDLATVVIVFVGPCDEIY